MKNAIRTILLSATLLTGVAQAQEPGSPEFDAAVRDYLLNNPEILLEMQEALQARQQEMALAQQQETLERDADRIYDSEHNIVLGNPDGDVTVVEFFDYNCAFCRRAVADMQAVIEQDPEVRFVLKEFPILGPASTEAHVVSMAVKDVAPETYGEFHTRLLEFEGQADRASAIAIATELGIDEAALEAGMAEGDSEAAFNESYEIANALQITGTPSYIVSGELMFGAYGADAILEAVARAREAAASN